LSHGSLGSQMSRTCWRVPVSAIGVAALSSAVVAGLLQGPAEASRTVTESYVVPADGVLRLTGHGYGHGHGMSQYGAQGAAKQGLTHRQILSFYYPGTTLATAGGTIRVLISADTDNDVRVVPASGLRVREVSTGTSYVLPATAGVKTWRLRNVAGRTVLDYDDGAWRTYLPGGKALSGEAEFYRTGAVTLRVAGTTLDYRGAMRLSNADTVNVLSIDEYVKGVVPREMPASWMPSAVQAQAVAARTYASWERADHPTRYYQTCDTTSCQVYGGVTAEDSRSNAAVDATANQILNHQGKPAFTQFGSSSGGWLAAGGMPYLAAKADPYDGFSGNPMHTWTTTLSRAAVQNAYPSLGTLQRVLVTQRDGNGEWYGRIEQMILDGSKSNVTLSGSAFRSKFGLRSQWIRFGTGSTPAPTTPPTVPPTGPPTTTPPAAPGVLTAITLRWRAIGGYRSVLGGPTSSEYAAGGSQVRRFQHGRIYATAGVGAHELHGRVLRAYLRKGETGSRLGFPRTAPTRFKRGTLARFENGTLKVFRSGRVKAIYR
jgi:stage II sporulation protein D